jgi:hypothetical protein
VRPGTSSSPSLQFTSGGDGSLIYPEHKRTTSARKGFMSKKRADKSEERSLIKKRRLAIRYGEKLHLSRSYPGSNKKEPAARIIPSTSKIATRVDDTTGIRYPDPMEGRYEPPVKKTYTRQHSFNDIFIDVVEQGQDSMWMYFMKFLSQSDLLVILTSNKGLFSSKVSYQLVMDLARRAFPKCAYTVIDNNNKIHNYFKCVYIYCKREPGCDHTPGTYTNIGVSTDLVEYQ